MWVTGLLGSGIKFASCTLGMKYRVTLSDGTAGGIEAGAITFDVCRAVTDRFDVVDEDEIAAHARLHGRAAPAHRRRGGRRGRVADPRR
jgi:hypothetical protein